MSECQVRHQWQGALKICYFPIGGAAGNCLALCLIFPRLCWLLTL